jgi:hypothetical protein
MDYQEPGVAKPGATRLVDMNVQGRKMPLLVTENYGRGRTAVLATSGTWRWQMNLPVGDQTHTLFWQQLLRWLVTDSPGHVVASLPSQVLLDDGRLALSADVRGEDFQPVVDARVEAHIIGPSGVAASVEMTPVPDMPGSFQAEWTADKSGSYLTEVSAWTASPRISTPNRTATCSSAWPRRPADATGVRKNCRSYPMRFPIRKRGFPRGRRESSGTCRRSFS